MKEFEPSRQFVSNVMKTVLAYEAERAESRKDVAQGFHVPGPIRRLLYYCGPLFGVLFVPATCL